METKELLNAISLKIMELISNMENEETEIEEQYSFDQEETNIVNSFDV